MARKTDDFEITFNIPNFEKWNDKRVGKDSAYFRVSAFLYDDWKFDRLSIYGKAIYVFMLTRIASNSGSSVCLLGSKLRSIGVPNAVNLGSIINQLSELQLVTIEKDTRKEGIKGKKEGRNITKKNRSETRSQSVPAETQPPADAVGADEKEIVPLKPLAPVPAFIAAYCEAYQSRYGNNPPIGGKGSGIAKRIVETVGQEKSLALPKVYLSMTDPWFLTKAHDLGTMEQNLAKIVMQADTGRSMTKGDIKQVESLDHWQSQAKRMGINL